MITKIIRRRGEEEKIVRSNESLIAIENEMEEAGKLTRLKSSILLEYEGILFIVGWLIYLDASKLYVSGWNNGV